MSKTNKTNFAKVIEELASAFVSDKRTDGLTFYRIKDDAPEWLRGHTFMLDVHQAIDDRAPDDWVYEHTKCIAYALMDYGSIDEADDAREAVHEICDGLVDVYTTDRLRWLASHIDNATLCDEAISEFGSSSEDDMVSRIGVGQYLALTRIAESVISQCESEAEARDERDAETADA